MQDMVRDVLEADGYEVVGIGHGGTAVALLAGWEPDLIVIDLMLPDTSGIRLAEQLRRNGQTHTPMIAMSADRIALLLAGRTGLFEATLPKPFDISELLDLAEQYTGRYMARSWARM